MSNTGAAIGIDIGGTKLLGVLLAADGTVLREERKSTPDGLEPLVKVACELVHDLGAPQAAPIGVGAAGLVDMEGKLSYAPNLPTIRDAPLRDLLAAATGSAVVVDNDANVAALGEVAYGAAKGAADALLVTLGTGIGGGMVMDRRIVRGAHGFAGEIGHITVQRDGPMCACGEPGHWEAIASGTTLGRMARELVASGRGDAVAAEAEREGSEVSGHHVGFAAATGDADALGVMAAFADNVALGLAALVNVLDPERIVIGGGLVELGAVLFDPLRIAFARHVEGVEFRPETQIVPAALGEHAGAIGAAVLARGLVG